MFGALEQPATFAGDIYPVGPLEAPAAASGGGATPPLTGDAPAAAAAPAPVAVGGHARQLVNPHHPVSWLLLGSLLLLGIVHFDGSARARVGR